MKMEMKRRSLLGAIGAALAALLPWKRTKAPKLVEAPPQPPHTGPCLFLVLESLEFYVAKFPGSHVVSSDDPLRRLLGWRVENDAGELLVEFRISLTDIRRGTPKPPQRIKEMLVYAKSRAELGQMIQQGELPTQWPGWGEKGPEWAQRGDA